MTNTLSIPPKLAVINSMAGYGRCSLSVALPVISALQVQGCPVLTSYFSNHMGFPSYFSKDMSDCLADYLAQWESLSLTFDGVYCGYLNDIGQAFILKAFIRYQKEHNKNHCHIIIDPVMGDHGHMYKSITPQFCKTFQAFIAEADILTPNLTEACILADVPYQQTATESQLITLCHKIRKLSESKIVITGIPLSDNSLGNFVYEDSTSYQLIEKEISGKNRSGTGDLFASIIAALTVRGTDFISSVQKAVDFTALCIRGSQNLQIPIEHGVCFENFLHQL